MHKVSNRVKVINDLVKPPYFTNDDTDNIDFTKIIQSMNGCTTDLQTLKSVLGFLTIKSFSGDYNWSRFLCRKL